MIPRAASSRAAGLYALVIVLCSVALHSTAFLFTGNVYLSGANRLDESSLRASSPSGSVADSASGTASPAEDVLQTGDAPRRWGMTIFTARHWQRRRERRQRTRRSSGSQPHASMLKTQELGWGVNGGMKKLWSSRMDILNKREGLKADLLRAAWLDGIDRQRQQNFSNAPSPLFGKSRPTRHIEVTSSVHTFEQDFFNTKRSGGAGLRMTVIKLKSGKLLLHSPVAPTIELLQMLLDTFGRKALRADNMHLVCGSRSPEHWAFLRHWSRRFPEAHVWNVSGVHNLVAGVGAESQSLLEHGVCPQAWGGEVDVAVIQDLPVFKDAVLFHRPSGTVMASDTMFQLSQARYTGQRRLTKTAVRLLKQDSLNVFAPMRVLLELGGNTSNKKEFTRKILMWDAKIFIGAHGDAPLTGPEVRPLMREGLMEHAGVRRRDKDGVTHSTSSSTIGGGEVGGVAATAATSAREPQGGRWKAPDLNMRRLLLWTED